MTTNRSIFSLASASCRPPLEQLDSTWTANGTACVLSQLLPWWKSASSLCGLHLLLLPSTICIVIFHRIWHSLQALILPEWYLIFMLLFVTFSFLIFREVCKDGKLLISSLCYKGWMRSEESIANKKDCTSVPSSGEVADQDHGSVYHLIRTDLS